MSKKYNNRILLGVFLVLAVILLITRFAGNGKRERTLNTEIVRIDTATVSGILLYPTAGQGKEIRFTRTGDTWEVSMEGRTVPGDAGRIMNMLTELAQLRSEQLVARSPDRWPGFQVDDSSATRVVVREGSETTLDLLVGRFSYQQPQQNNYNPYGRNQVNGKTFVRLNGQDEVHAVEGFLAMTLNQPFDSWRNADVTRFNQALLSRLVFDYPADSGFVAERNEAGWMVAGMLADSLSMSRYLNRLSGKQDRNFFSGSTPARDPAYHLTLEGDNMETIQVSAWISDSSNYVIHSSLNPETWFLSDRGGLFGDLYPGAGELLTGEGD